MLDVLELSSTLSIRFTSLTGSPSWFTPSQVPSSALALCLKNFLLLLVSFLAFLASLLLLRLQCFSSSTCQLHTWNLKFMKKCETIYLGAAEHEFVVSRQPRFQILAFGHLATLEEKVVVPYLCFLAALAALYLPHSFIN